MKHKKLKFDFNVKMLIKYIKLYAKEHNHDQKIIQQ